MSSKKKHWLLLAVLTEIRASQRGRQFRTDDRMTTTTITPSMAATIVITPQARTTITITPALPDSSITILYSKVLFFFSYSDQNIAKFDVKPKKLVNCSFVYVFSLWRQIWLCSDQNMKKRRTLLYFFASNANLKSELRFSKFDFYMKNGLH